MMRIPGKRHRAAAVVAAALGGTFVITSVHAETIYKSVDQNGAITYHRGRCRGHESPP